MTLKSFLEYFALGLLILILILTLYRIYQIIKENSGIEKREFFSSFENLITFVITLSFGMFGYNLYSSYDIKETKKELEIISQKYEESINALDSLKLFSENQEIFNINDNTPIITEETKSKVKQSLNMFSYLFIASAILSDEKSATDKSFMAWQIAYDTNPDVPLCRYGLAMEYYKLGLTQRNKDAEGYSTSGVLNFIKAHNLLSNKNVLEYAEAKYYYGITSIIYISNMERVRTFSEEKIREERYKIAKKAILILETLDVTLYNKCEVEYNLYKLYKALATNTRSKKEFKKYFLMAENMYNIIINIEEYAEELKDIGLETIKNKHI